MISVVIPCLNEEKYILDCVNSLLNNGFTEEELEILIVDGGSTDKTLNIVNDIISKNECVRLLDNPNRKTPFALNIGIQSAQGEYILIAGAHARYPAGYIKTLYSLILNDDIDVVGGAIETQVKIETAKAEAIKFVLSHPLGVGNSQFRTGADSLMQVDTVPFGLYKKEIFQNIGLYNEQLIRNHDIELSKRIKFAGYKIWLEPHLKVVYYARDNFTALAKNNYGNGFWNIKTVAITKRFSSLSLRHYIPLIFLMSIILPVLAGVVYSGFYLIAILSFLLYFISVGVIAIKNMGSYNPFYLIIAFVVLHISYGAGELVAFFSILFHKD